MPLVLQPYGEHGEVQDPAVGRLLEGELAVQGQGVLVHAPAVQLPGSGLLIRQGPWVQAVPPQTLVRVVVSSAAQGHLLLLLVLSGLEVHAEALRDGLKGNKDENKVYSNQKKKVLDMFSNRIPKPIKMHIGPKKETTKVPKHI